MITQRLEKSSTVKRRLAKKRVQCLNEDLFLVSSSMLADNLVLKTRLWKTAKLKALCCYKSQHKNLLK